MSTDIATGSIVHDALVQAGIETPLQEPMYSIGTQQNIQESFSEIMKCLALDLQDDSLKDTPKRVAKMFAKEIFYGLDYRNFPKCTVIENKMQADEMVCIKSILVRSVCEHHFVPFIGVAHIAYIPDKHIMGLSKFNRVVDFFCRRPQVQERLTEQVSLALRTVLQTADVGVIIDAEHFCVKLRGIQDPHSSTTTSKMAGRFKTVPALRDEFIQLSRKD